MALARTALVTGSARRIGAHLVRTLADSGFAVAIHCRQSRTDAERLASSIRAGGGRAEVFVADLAHGAEVDALVPEVAARMGPIGLLINNASVFEPDGLPGISRASFEMMQAVNYMAPVLLASAFAAQVPAGEDGLVVNMLDQRVLKPTPTFFSYATAKQALWAAQPMMAQALAPDVRVNAIAPGPTLQSVRQRPEDFAFQAQATLLQRGPALDEFTAALQFLIAARSVTGQTLVLDGGQHLNWQTPDVVNAGE